MAAEEHASGGRAEPAGSPRDILALHRRAATSLRRRAAEPGAKKRAVRAIRALEKGAAAVRRCSVPALDLRFTHATAFQIDAALCGCPCGCHPCACVGRAWRHSSCRLCPEAL